MKHQQHLWNTQLFTEPYFIAKYRMWTGSSDHHWHWQGILWHVFFSTLFFLQERHNLNWFLTSGEKKWNQVLDHFISPKMKNSNISVVKKLLYSSYRCSNKKLTVISAKKRTWQMLEELLEIHPHFPRYLCMKVYKANLTSSSWILLLSLLP